MASESNTSKLMKGMSSQTLVTLMLGFVEIVSFSIMSRLLTQQDFGYYAALFAVMIVFSSLSETGIGSAIIQKKKLNKEYVNNAFTLCSLFGFVVSLLMFVSAGFLANWIIDSSMVVPLRLLSLTIFCNSLTSAYVSMLYRELKFLTVGIINLGSQIITTSIAIYLAYLGLGYYAIITKTVSSSILILVIVIIVSKVRFSFSWNSSIIKTIWGFSSWLMASVIFRNFSQQADRLLMSKLLSVDMLGAYNRPKEFINQISSKINGIFDTTLFPILSGIQDNLESLQRSYHKSLYLLNILSSILTVLFFVNSELIIRIFFGPAWLNLVPVFQILSLALIFNIDGRLSDCYLRALGLTKPQFFFRVFETVVKFGGVIVGAIWGIYGVAFAVVFANCSMIIVKVIYIANKINIPTIETFRTILQSWIFLIYLVPIAVVSLIYLPHTVAGNIILCLIIAISLLIQFFAFPQLVGKMYREQVFPKVLRFVSQKVHYNATKSK